MSSGIIEIQNSTFGNVQLNISLTDIVYIKRLRQECSLKGEDLKDEAIDTAEIQVDQHRNRKS